VASSSRRARSAAEEWTRDDTVDRMRGLYQFRRRRLKARGGYLDDDGAKDRSLAYQRLVRELLEAQRREIVLLPQPGRDQQRGDAPH
jgi:monovalent cation/hydrogen antiporter